MSDPHQTQVFERVVRPHFDRLYRLQLRTLYDMLGTSPPKSIDTPISSGGGNAENAGTMRRGHS